MASGGAEDWGACQFDGQCEVIAAGCCEACEPVQSSQLRAVNKLYFSAQQNAECPRGAACAPCTITVGDEGTRRYFRATCSAGQCAVMDVRDSPLSACNADSDCEIRPGANCCLSCTGTDFVPVNKDADFCGGQPYPCPLCSPNPSEYRAVCSQGMCVFQPAPR